jgi:hypothetical protein
VGKNSGFGEMGIIPEDDEERWGTGKFDENGSALKYNRPDMENMDGYEDEDTLRRATNNLNQDNLNQDLNVEPKPDVYEEEKYEYDQQDTYH